MASNTRRVYDDIYKGVQNVYRQNILRKRVIYTPSWRHSEKWTKQSETNENSIEYFTYNIPAIAYCWGRKQKKKLK